MRPPSQGSDADGGGGVDVDVNPHIWKACAGSGAAVQIPRVGEHVFYFPEGHAEHSSSPIDLAATAGGGGSPLVFCQTSSVRLLADRETDEVFYRVVLQPIGGTGAVAFPVSLPEALPEVASFPKILTSSDANNGGGFSVPRFCADSIFPPLDFAASPPVQTLFIRDVHGRRWEFKHIFRGSPRRHLLTTGWSKFVTDKRLVVGDTVVFIRSPDGGELSVGIRRRLGFQTRRADQVRRNAPANTVVEAMRKAWAGVPFEIEHYPRNGLPDFVVSAAVVEAARRVYWVPGCRVKMAVEAEDSARMTWFQGSVSSIGGGGGGGPWENSPWRMLHVNWDEPDAMPNLKTVNPWQVVLDTATMQHQATFHPFNKLHLSEISELHRDGAKHFYKNGISNSLIGDVFTSLYNHNNFPAGMQGARHDTINGSSLPNLMTDRKNFDIAAGNTSPSSNNSSKHNQSGELFGSSISSQQNHSGEIFGNGNSPQQNHSGEILGSGNSTPTHIRLFGQDIYANGVTPNHLHEENINCEAGHHCSWFSGSIPLKKLYDAHMLAINTIQVREDHVSREDENSEAAD
ncbi:Auxin response factor 10 [Acorus calamus]|uniref:Auxin response factor n=1 Tax=Acorus calamus TaxID=4465 RepID=A0AAV9DJT1_ACOCL|nr:Auxin response factor 10 [Acorus calamus]